MNFCKCICSSVSIRTPVCMGSLCLSAYAYVGLCSLRCVFVHFLVHGFALCVRDCAVYLVLSDSSLCCGLVFLSVS